MSEKKSKNGLMPIIFSQENKAKMMREILGNLLKQETSILLERENDIMRWMLVGDLNIIEASKKIGLSPRRTFILFNRGLRRFGYYCSEVSSMFHTFKKMEENIESLTKKLREYEVKEQNTSSLSPETMELLKIKVAEVGFTSRLKNCLRYAKINTVADLVKMSKRDLQFQRNVGKFTLTEVEDFFKEHQLTWDMQFI